MMSKSKPVIAFDGTESAHGRAFLCISALYYSADWLPALECRLIDIADENVRLAAETLEWDMGLSLDIWSAERIASDGSPLANVALYAGIACGSARHMRLAEAGARQVPTFLAIQFPDREWLAPAVILRQEAAFDPRRFAESLASIVRLWIL